MTPTTLMADGTERLCRALYGRKATTADYLGGSDARMLHDAADRLTATPRADAVCVICHSDEPHTGACGSSDPRALCNQNSADAAGGGREDVLRFGIQVEKLLCGLLGRPWSAAGISIESLCADIAAKLTTPPASDAPADPMLAATHASDDPIWQMRKVCEVARESDRFISRQWVQGWADRWEAERAASDAPATVGDFYRSQVWYDLSNDPRYRYAAKRMNEGFQEFDHDTVYDLLHLARELAARTADAPDAAGTGGSNG